MEIYCSEGNTSIKIKEISMACTLEEIKKLETFFRITWERHKEFSDFDPNEVYHTHFQDWDKEWDEVHDIIVVTLPCKQDE